MRLPKTIKIGGHQYRVIFPYIFTERNDRTGDCDFSGKIIRIVEAVGGEKRSDSAIVTTLIHEILHAIDNVTGQKMFDTTNGEDMIDGLSEGIYQVLVDNPKLKDII